MAITLKDILKEQDTRVSSVIIHLIETFAIQQFGRVMETNSIAKQIDECIRKKSAITVDATGININSLINFYTLIEKTTKDPIY